MLLQFDGGILLLALLSLLGIAFQVSWQARCSTDVDISIAVTAVFAVQLHPFPSSVCHLKSRDKAGRGGGEGDGEESRE